ncbi:MAG: molybdopterin molybdotransferase MoeA [Alphaproteobacteria bacterium]
MPKCKEKLTSFKKAQRIMSKFKVKNEIEIIKLENSENRVLAENIFAPINIPEYDNSAVDGYGFINKKVKKRKLNLVGESKPGKPFLKKINENQVIKVFTGAYIINENTNIDTVCMEEECKIFKKEVLIDRNYKTGSNIRKKAEDIKKNSKIFSKGRKIRPLDLAQLSSIGIRKLKVYKKLKVGIFSSGSELSSNKNNKKKYEIYDSNKLALCSLFKRIGCEIIDLGIIKDNKDDTKNKISKKLSSIDVLVTSGGVSKSKTDEIGKFFYENGKILFWRLSIKPGRPFIFGEIRNKPFIGLPGNPVAAIVTFFMIVINFIKNLSGENNVDFVERILPCNFNVEKKIGRTEWIRGNMFKKDNSFYLERFKSTGSGIISSLSQSQGIIELDEENDYVKKGSLLKFYKYEDMLN